MLRSSRSQPRDRRIDGLEKLYYNIIECYLAVRNGKSLQTQCGGNGGVAQRRWMKLVGLLSYDRQDLNSKRLERHHE